MSAVPRRGSSLPAWRTLLRWLSSLRRLSVARKLKISLVACAAGLLLVAAVYAWTRYNSERAADTFATHQQATSVMALLGTQVADARRLQTRYAASFDDADRNALQQARQRLQVSLEALQRTAAANGNAASLRALATRIGEFAEGINALNARVDEMGRGEAGLRAQLEAAAAAMEAALGPLQRPALDAQWQAIRRQEALLLLTGDSTHADRASDAKLPFELALTAPGVPAAAQDALRTAMDSYQGALLGYTAARVGLDVEAQSLADTAAQIAPSLEQVQRAQAMALEAARGRLQAQARAMTVVFAVTLLLVAALLIATLLLTLQAVQRPIANTLRFAEAIAEDRLDTVLVVHNPHDEFGQLAQRLRHMQERLRGRIEAERAAARDNTRARQALDSAQTGLMVLEPDGRIGFLNQALCSALGCTPGQWHGQPAQVLHPVFAGVAA